MSKSEPAWTRPARKTRQAYPKTAQPEAKPSRRDQSKPQDKSLPAAEAEVTYVFIAARSRSRPHPASVLAIPAIGKQPPAPSTLQSGTSAMVGKEVGEGREKEILTSGEALKEYGIYLDDKPSIALNA